MKLKLLSIFLLTISAHASDVEFFCIGERTADARGWSVVFHGSTLKMTPNEAFPENIQESKTAILLKNPSPKKSLPEYFGDFVGKTDKGEELHFSLTSILLSSVEWSSTNFYSAILWTESADAKLICTGPKSGIHF
jgi:hypothetical protein